MSDIPLFPLQGSVSYHMERNRMPLMYHCSSTPKYLTLVDGVVMSGSRSLHTSSGYSHSVRFEDLLIIVTLLV